MLNEKEIKEKIKYPIITKENFEEMMDKIVVERKLWNKSWKCWDYYKCLKLEPPRNLKEFQEITKNLYGIKLSVDCLTYGLNAFGDNHQYACKYEIREDQDEYSKGKIYQLWEKKFSQYDGLKLLLNLTFGVLSCGGVAGHHYGQTRCNRETWLRVKNWDNKNEEKKMVDSIMQWEKEELQKPCPNCPIKSGATYRMVHGGGAEPKANWYKTLRDEFGIHFKDSPDELKFLEAFIEDLLAEEKEKQIMAIDKKITENFNQDLKKEGSELVEIIKKAERKKMVGEIEKECREHIACNKLDDTSKGEWVIGFRPFKR